MRRLIVMVGCMLLVISACGGSSVEETDDPAGPEAPDTTTQSNDPDDVGASDDQAGDETGADDDAGSSGTSSGVATIAGETYRFADTGSLGTQCDPSFQGAGFIAGLGQVDESGAEVDGGLAVGFPLPGFESLTPVVTVTIDGRELIANSEHVEEQGIPAGSSQVDSYEIDGNTVTGTATFYDRSSSFGDGDLVVEQGTFEVTCAG